MFYAGYRGKRHVAFLCLVSKCYWKHRRAEYILEFIFLNRIHCCEQSKLLWLLEEQGIMLRPAFLVDWTAMLLRLAYNIYLPCLKLMYTQYWVAIQLKIVKSWQKTKPKRNKTGVNYKNQMGIVSPPTFLELKHYWNHFFSTSLKQNQALQSTEYLQHARSLIGKYAPFYRSKMLKAILHSAICRKGNPQKNIVSVIIVLNTRVALNQFLEAYRQFQDQRETSISSTRAPIAFTAVTLAVLCCAAVHISFYQWTPF